jgi:hypothetical protein
MRRQGHAGGHLLLRKLRTNHDQKIKMSQLDDAPPPDDGDSKQAPPISFSSTGQLMLFGVEATPEV